MNRQQNNATPKFCCCIRSRLLEHTFLSATQLQTWQIETTRLAAIKYKLRPNGQEGVVCVCVCCAESNRNSDIGSSALPRRAISVARTICRRRTVSGAARRQKPRQPARPGHSVKLASLPIMLGAHFLLQIQYTRTNRLLAYAHEYTHGRATCAREQVCVCV